MNKNTKYYSDNTEKPHKHKIQEGKHNVHDKKNKDKTNVSLKVILQISSKYIWTTNH